MPRLGDASCASFAPAFPEENPGLSLSAASPSPGRTGAARFHFALARNDMLKEGRVRGGKNVARNDMQKIVALLRVQEGACRGKPATAHEFALSVTFSYLSLRGRGLPRRFAPRNDMLKTGRCLRGQGRFPAAPRYCANRRQVLHVIARTHLG